MRRWLLACLAILSAPAAMAAEAPETREAKIVRASLEYCYEPLKAGISPAKFAEEKKLAVSEADEVFTTQRSAKNYTIIPSVAVLMTMDEPMCSVAVKKMDSAVFWRSVLAWYGPQSPFKVKKDEPLEDTQTRYLEAQVGDQYFLVVISAREESDDNSIQGMITIALSDKPED